MIEIGQCYRYVGKTASGTYKELLQVIAPKSEYVWNCLCHNNYEGRFEDKLREGDMTHDYKMISEREYKKESILMELGRVG